MLIEDLITEVYCMIDNVIKKITKNAPLRQRGLQPKLSDELVAMLALH